MQDFLHTFCGVGSVQPAMAMGTFLRVWRSEWAGLSRAQLATAVQRHVNGRKRVTSGVIRWWEAGQPPASTEELEALCLVMRAHELTAPEVEQFRSVVFAACANRQYPELFDPLDLQSETGMRAALSTAYAWRDAVPSPPVVLPVALFRQLAEGTPGTQGETVLKPDRNRYLALYHLQCIMANRHTVAGRYEQAAAACEAAGGICRRLSGPTGRAGAEADPTGLGWSFAAIALRRYAVCRGVRPWSYDSAHGVIPVADSAGQSSSLCRQILRLAQRAHAGGDHDLALRCVVSGAQPWFLGEACSEALHGVYAPFVEKADELWHSAEGQNRLFMILLGEGLVRDAERLLGRFAMWEHGTMVERCQWYQALGDLAALRGASTEAVGHYERGLALPEHDHTQWYADQFKAAIAALVSS